MTQITGKLVPACCFMNHPKTLEPVLGRRIEMFLKGTTDFTDATDKGISESFISAIRVIRGERWQASCQCHPRQASCHPIERARLIGGRADQCVTFRAHF